MRIIIAGGTNEADFLIKMFQKKKHQLTIINEDERVCEWLSRENHISVHHGDPSKEYSLMDANIKNADILIALTPLDADNLVICQLAREVFNIKRCVCVVSNPKNVEIFKKLGLKSVISSTYLVAQTIERHSIVDNLIRTLPIEEEKIVLTEMEIDPDYSIVGKQLKDIDFPKDLEVNISCIFRDPEVIIPTGKTKIMGGDRLVVVSTPESQELLIDYVQKK